MNPILALCSLLALVSAGPSQYFREEFGDGGETPSSVNRGGGGGAVVLGWGEEFNNMQMRSIWARIGWSAYFFRALILRENNPGPLWVSNPSKSLRARSGSGGIWAEIHGWLWECRQIEGRCLRAARTLGFCFSPLRAPTHPPPIPGHLRLSVFLFFYFFLAQESCAVPAGSRG